MYQMVFAVRDQMAIAYPELKDSAERVSKVILAEENQFSRVVERGSLEWNRLIVREWDKAAEIEKALYRRDCGYRAGCRY